MDKRYRRNERRKWFRASTYFRSHVENCLKSIWETYELEPDGDGDYGFFLGESPAWVMVGDHGPQSTVRVIAYACVEVKRTAKLLVELNEINAAGSLARAYWVDGTVVVEASLPWQLVDQSALRYQMDAVEVVSDQVAELITLVHGGRRPFEAMAPEADDEVA